MKKIGIITKYYNSANFGGLLQSFALTNYLRANGYNAFQICFDEKNNDKKIAESNLIKRFSELSFKEKLSAIKRKIKNIINRYLTILFLKNKNKLRRQAFIDFRHKIPHSLRVYNRNTIREVNSEADFFITGSDRVWSEKTIGDEYYLTFVESARKISYAASLRANTLDSKQKASISEILNGFDAISVREKDTVTLLSDICEKLVHFVLDPSFLLPRSEWDKIADEDIFDCSFKYIFCYFLGDDISNRRLVKRFAKAKKLKIITLPFSKETFNIADFFFGDSRLTDVTPNRFLSLIRNAEYVFTDSFHASVFSLIFHRQLFIMPRAEMKDSGTRIESLISIAGIEERFYRKANIKTLLSQDEIEYPAVEDRIQNYRKQSCDFLREALQ